MNHATQDSIRKQGKAARSALSSAQRAFSSARAVRNLCSHGIFLAARTIACYIPVGAEVDTTEVFSRAWKMQKRIFAPVTMRDRSLIFREINPDTTLERNAYGLWQPSCGNTLDASAFDVVVAPVVAFDGQCNRIGMGGGYYDHTFSFTRNRSMALRPRLVGIAFESQKVPEIKANSWDVPLWRIFTEAQ